MGHGMYKGSRILQNLKQLGSTKTLHKHTIQFWGHTTASVAVTSGEGEVIGSMDMESLVCVLRHMELVILHSHQ